MISLDTNVLVRLLTGDDRRQMAAAVKLIDAHPCFVPLSVALELEWVLRGAYGLDRGAISKLYDGLLSAINLHFEAESILLAAVRLYKEGLDFADALHLSSSFDCDTFYTFDKKFLSRSAGLKPPCRLPEP
ncbi:MAG: type II toxin-antitoxin system VapC family toxin [Nitrospirae bacterium]|nr:type II toxin-antitoxin system VapC family toxin [Nitrospirota bacterium]